MATRKKKNARMKPHYVRKKKRTGAGSTTMMRRSVSIALLLMILGGLLFGLWAGFNFIEDQLFSNNPRFEMQHLIISCDGKLTEDRIREYTGLAEGMNLFEMDFKAIENALARVSEVESVYLERKLPHTLMVKVTERIPVARILGNQSRRYPFVVDRYGVVLPPRKSAVALPLIQGVEKDLRLGVSVGEPDVEIALKIIALCDSSSTLRTYVKLERVDVKYSDFIDLRLQGGIRARMPRFSLKPKLQDLATVIKIARGQGMRVKEVDLTLDSSKVPVSYY